MLKYLKYSLIIHGVLLGLAVSMAWWQPAPEVKKLKFLVLPKGTTLDAGGPGATPPDMELPSLTEPDDELAMAEPTPVAEVTPEVIPALTPVVTPVATPVPTAAPTPVATPRLTPLPVKQTPTPAPTPEMTPEPTPEVTPKPTPEPTPKPTATPKPKPTATPKPKPTATPKPKTTPKTEKKKSDESEKSEKDKDKDKSDDKVEESKKSKSEKKEIASVYEAEKAKEKEKAKADPAGEGEGEGGTKAGKTGVPDGVEGAPLPLDRPEGTLSSLYTNRAILLLSQNFIAPPGIDDPDLVCVVEWEILTDGTVQNIKIVKTTGNEELDRAAFDAVKNTGNLGRLPPEHGGQSLWVSLPFIFGQ